MEVLSGKGSSCITVRMIIIAMLLLEEVEMRIPVGVPGCKGVESGACPLVEEQCREGWAGAQEKG